MIRQLNNGYYLTEECINKYSVDYKSNYTLSYSGSQIDVPKIIREEPLGSIWFISYTNFMIDQNIDVDHVYELNRMIKLLHTHKL